MKRRDLIRLIGGASVTWALPASAHKVPVIGLLGANSVDAKCLDRGRVSTGMNALVDLLKRLGIMLGCTAIFGALGFIVPMFFDRGVGGAVASGLLGISGPLVGAVIGHLTIRRFDLAS